MLISCLNATSGVKQSTTLPELYKKISIVLICSLSLHSMIKYQKKPNGLLIFRTKVGRFLTFLIVTMGNKHNRAFSTEENSFVLYFED